MTLSIGVADIGPVTRVFSGGEGGGAILDFGSPGYKAALSRLDRLRVIQAGMPGL
jgi:hypothetical protein